MFFFNFNLVWKGISRSQQFWLLPIQIWISKILFRFTFVFHPFRVFEFSAVVPISRSSHWGSIVIQVSNPVFVFCSFYFIFKVVLKRLSRFVLTVYSDSSFKQPCFNTFLFSSVDFFFFELSGGATDYLACCSFAFCRIRIEFRKSFPPFFTIFFQMKLKVSVWGTISQLLTVFRFWFEFQKSFCRTVFPLPPCFHLQPGVVVTISLVLTDCRLWIEFRKPVFRVLSDFLYFDISAGAIISVSLDCFSIMIRASKILVRCFSVFCI